VLLSGLSILLASLKPAVEAHVKQSYSPKTVLEEKHKVQMRMDIHIYMRKHRPAHIPMLARKHACECTSLRHARIQGYCVVLLAAPDAAMSVPL